MASSNQASEKHIDTIIVGQGLAGCLLAWKLARCGQRILLIGDPALDSASAVAAGLFNPVTGKRLVLLQQAGQRIEAALLCYRELEHIFKQPLFHDKPMLRILRSELERDVYRKRADDPDYAPYLGETCPAPDGVRAPHGLFRQQQTGYLDTLTLMHTLISYFQSQNAYIPAHFDHDELNLERELIRWRNISARRIIFCEGHHGTSNPWFDWLPFQGAGGEILSFTSHDTLPEEIINGGHWLIPRSDGSYKTGATYHHESEATPTDAGRSQLLAGLDQLLTDRPDITITSHDAGVRPGTLDKQPFIGLHAQDARIAIFNGFGSRGSMQIPWHADAFTAHLLHGDALPPHCDIARIKRPRQALTAQVHQALARRIPRGATAIDATAGNGHDTLFLAECVGETGRVHAFDIQQQALENTSALLSDSGMQDRICLHQAGHETIAASIPATEQDNIAVILFNLGYLPNGDKQMVTSPETTLTALDAASQIVAPNGIISVLAYPGHPGGSQELEAVKSWASALPREFIVRLHPPTNRNGNCPEWIEIVRRKHLKNQ